jgi:hypothetical protein
MMHSDQMYIDADIAREMIFEQFPSRQLARSVPSMRSSGLDRLQLQGSLCAQQTPSPARMCYATKPPL